MIKALFKLPFNLIKLPFKLIGLAVKFVFLPVKLLLMPLILLTKILGKGSQLEGLLKLTTLFLFFKRDKKFL